MATVLKSIEAEAKYHRVTVLINHDKTLYFGLMVERQHETKGSYWCFYLGLTVSQYRYLRGLDLEVPVFTFLGAGNDVLNVLKAQCDTLLMDQPTHYVGIDSAPGVLFYAGQATAMLEVFATQICEMLENHNADS